MLTNLLNSVLSKMRFNFVGEIIPGIRPSEFKKIERRKTTDGIPLLAGRKTDPAYRSIYL